MKLMSCRRFSAACVVLACSSIVLAWALPATAGGDIPRATVINVIAGVPTEFKFGFRFSGKPGVPLGTVVFKVRNAGKLAHTFKICSSPGAFTRNSCIGKSTASIAPGKTASLSFTFKKKGTYEYLCTVPGHAAAGMKGPLTAA
jgi:plastocyanin